MVVRTVCIAALFLLAALPAALAAGPSITHRDVPLRRPEHGSPVRCDEAIRHARRALAWRRGGRVQDAKPCRHVERLAPRSTRGRGSSRRGQGEAPRRLAPRQPVVDGLVRPLRATDARSRDAGPRLADLELGGAHPASPGVDRGLAAGSSRGKDGRRTRRSAARRLATPRCCRWRSSTTRPGGTGSGPEDSAAIVRGIELYHVKANGWNDIGYNFLVDRWGQVFEGRYGGMTQNVIGAHAEGFNTGSVGIAADRHVLIEEAVEGGGGRAGEAARVAARRRPRRSRVLGDDPVGRQPALPCGRGRVPARDLRAPRHGLHVVPGQRALRAARPLLTEVAATTGLPKLYEPSAPGALGKIVRFAGPPVAAARLDRDRHGPSPGRAWPASREWATAIAWSWNSAGHRGRSLHVDDRGGERPAGAGRDRQGQARRLASAPAAAATSPVGRHRRLRTSCHPTRTATRTCRPSSYRLGRAARGDGRRSTTSTGCPQSTLVLERAPDRRASAALPWLLDAVPDGRYTRRRVGSRGQRPDRAADGRSDGDARDRLGSRADPSSFSPDGDGVDDTILFSFTATKGVQVAVEVRAGGPPARARRVGVVRGRPARDRVGRPPAGRGDCARLVRAVGDGERRDRDDLGGGAVRRHAAAGLTTARD